MEQPMIIATSDSSGDDDNKTLTGYIVFAFVTMAASTLYFVKYLTATRESTNDNLVYFLTLWLKYIKYSQKRKPTHSAVY